jgi:hypothetical protein
MTLKQLFKAKDENEIIGLCEQFYNQGVKARKDYIPIWTMCERFYKGTDIDRDYIKQIAFNILPNIDKTGYIHIENAIKPLVKQAMAIICDSMSRVTCVPATNEEEDLEASYIASDFLQSREESDEEQIVRRNELTSLLVYGECARFTRYNPNKESEDGVAGDIETWTIDPSQYVRSITNNNSNKPDWIILTEVYDIDRLKELYPGKEIYPEKVIITQYGNMRLEKHEQTQDKCIVKRMYVREDKENPKGKYYAWTGNTLLQEGELPDGIFPFVVFKWLYQPGYVYPEGFVEPLIRSQITINDGLLKLRKLAEKKANPPILMAGNSEVREETMQESGQDIYRYKMGYDKPEFLQFPQDMQEVYNLIAMAREEMMSIAGLRETSLGRQPREATATQMALLKRSDNAGIGYFKYAFEKTFAKVCHTKLELAKKYFKQERLIKIVGVDRKPYVSKFYGADLKGVIDVKCEPTTYIDDAMRQQIMMQLITAGAFTMWQGVEDGYSKMSMILNSGLPNARDIVDNILGDKMTFDELQEIAGSVKNEKTSLEIMNLELSKLNAEVQGQQLQLQFAQGQMAQAQMVAGQGEEEPMPIGAETGLQDNPQEQTGEEYASQYNAPYEENPDDYVSSRVYNNVAE